MQNRLNSWVFWASLFAQVLSVLVLVGAVTPTQSEAINGVITVLLQALVSFGVLNNPTDPDHF